MKQHTSHITSHITSHHTGEQVPTKAIDDLGEPASAFSTWGALKGAGSGGDRDSQQHCHLLTMLMNNVIK